MVGLISLQALSLKKVNSIMIGAKLKPIADSFNNTKSAAWAPVLIISRAIVIVVAIARLGQTPILQCVMSLVVNIAYTIALFRASFFKNTGLSVSNKLFQIAFLSVKIRYLILVLNQSYPFSAVVGNNDVGWYIITSTIIGSISII